MTTAGASGDSSVSGLDVEEEQQFKCGLKKRSRTSGFCALSDHCLLRVIRCWNVPITCEISQHTGVYNPFQTTLFTKGSIKNTFQEKVTGSQAINACVPRWGHQLSANGLRLRTEPAFLLSDLFASKCCHKGGFGSLETQRLFCCAARVIYNQTDGLSKLATADSHSAIT